MTLKEIERMDKPVLTPAQVASAIGGDAHTIRVTARQRPDLLGFPVIVVGNRVKIPRIPFLRFMEGNL